MHQRSKIVNIKRTKLANNYRNIKKLWLDKNENLEETIINGSYQKLMKINKKILFSYPNLYPLYLSLSKYLNINKNKLLITSGSDSAIKAIFETFVRKNDGVLRTNPTYGMYSVYSKIYGAKEIIIEYEKTDGGPKIEFGKIIKLIEKTKPRLICLVNPDNPTGHILSENQILILLKKAKSLNSLVLVDEAYYPFYNYSVKKFLKRFNNLIITRSGSKALGLAGLRVGYIISSNSIIKELNKTKSIYEINSIAAELFKNILKKKTIIDSSIKNLLEGKKYFRKEIEKLGFDLFDREEGNFVHVNFKNKKIVNELKKISYFKYNENHKSIKNFSRFTITNKEKFKKVIRIIKKFHKNKSIKKKKELSPLFIGFGKQAKEYAKILKFLKIKISSVCVKNITKHQKEFDYYKIRNKYSDITKALNDDKFNCVFVFLPWDIIEKKMEIIIKNTKKKIYVEKPVALSYKKINHLCNLSKLHNRKVYVLLNRRFFNNTKILKSILKKEKTSKFNIPITEDIITNKKIHGKKIIKYLKYHRIIHWYDFFINALNLKLKKFNFQKKNFYTINYNKEKKITLEYYSKKNIGAKITTKNKILKFDKLENLTIYRKNSNKKIKRYNELSNNNFKPGILNLLKKIINKDKIDQDLPDLFKIKKIYNILKFLPY